MTDKVLVAGRYPGALKGELSMGPADESRIREFFDLANDGDLIIFNDEADRGPVETGYTYKAQDGRRHDFKGGDKVSLIKAVSKLQLGSVLHLSKILEEVAEPLKAKGVWNLIVEVDGFDGTKAVSMIHMPTGKALFRMEPDLNARVGHTMEIGKGLEMACAKMITQICDRVIEIDHERTLKAESEAVRKIEGDVDDFQI